MKNPLAHESVLGKIAVARGHMWFAIGLLGDRTVYVPISADHVTATRRGVIHAVVLSIAPTRRKTVDTVCGVRAYPFVVDANEGVAVVPLWPSPAKFPGLVRCRACWEATGRRRPDALFKVLKVVAA